MVFLSNTTGFYFSKRYQLYQNTNIYTYFTHYIVLREFQEQKRGTIYSMQIEDTDDHYTCFSKEESGLRLHDYMSVMVPKKEIDVHEENIKLLLNGMVEYTYTPETNRHYVGLVNDYKLNPGEEIIIKCPHGIKGSIGTRSYSDDGSLRRKCKCNLTVPVSFYLNFSWLHVCNI